MNCGLCYAYLREKNSCPGCRKFNAKEPISIAGCRIRNCPKLKFNFCFKCDDYPCKRIKHIDKEGYPGSLEVTVPKLRPCGLLVTDKLLWDGEVVEAEAERASTRAVKEYNRMLYAHPELETVILPLRDGVGVSRRR